MHVHIALIGGQPVPILTVIDALCQGDCPIDKIVVVYSEQSRKIWDFIRENVDESQNIEEVSLDATNISEIKPKFEELAQRFSGADRLSVNLSGGTKAWSYFAQKEMDGMPNASLYYIDQKNNLYNLTDMTSDLVEPFDVDRLKSQSVSLSEYTDAEAHDRAEIEKFRRCSFGLFNRLTDESNRDKQQSHEEDKKGNVLSFAYDEDGGTYNLSYESPIRGEVNYALSSPKAKGLLFNYGWFEFKIAKLIERCKWKNGRGEDVRPENIKLNCKFSSDSNYISNEIDIRFTADGRQFFVEVKTKLSDTTDLDKFNSVVNTVAGNGALKLFVTEGDMKNYAVEKCDRYHIKYLRTHTSDGSYLKYKGDEVIIKELNVILAELAKSNNV